MVVKCFVLKGKWVSVNWMTERIELFYVRRSHISIFQKAWQDRTVYSKTDTPALGDTPTNVPAQGGALAIEPAVAAKAALPLPPPSLTSIKDDGSVLVDVGSRRRPKAKAAAKNSCAANEMDSRTTKKGTENEVAPERQQGTKQTTT